MKPARFALAAERMLPAKAGKPGKVAIRGDPFAIGFDGQRGQMRVGHEIAMRGHRATELGEDSPMPRPRRDGNARRARADLLAKGQSDFERGRLVEDLRVRHDAHETAEDDIRHAEWLAAIQNLPKPGLIARKFGAVLAVSVD